jgi:hypothetical protein
MADPNADPGAKLKKKLNSSLSKKPLNQNKKLT